MPENRKLRQKRSYRREREEAISRIEIYSTAYGISFSSFPCNQASRIIYTRNKCSRLNAGGISRNAVPSIDDGLARE